MKKTYKIPCYWEVYGSTTVKANSLDEAIKIAENDGFSGKRVRGVYVTDSFGVDHHFVTELNKEIENGI
jgi:hypothetical protein